MTYYNVTFITTPEDCPAVVSDIRGMVMDALDQESESMKLLQVIGSPDSPDFAEHAVSLPLQIELSDDTDYEAWSREHLLPALERFGLKWGERAMMMRTILRTL